MTDLNRFVIAQNNGHPSLYQIAILELCSGRKSSHWIWFVLPQLQGLGSSDMAQRYGIRGLAEAQAYLANPLLRKRLEDMVRVICEQLELPGQSLEHLMSSDLDAVKTISCLTLFEAAGAAGLTSAKQLLDQIGRRCEKTIALLT